MKASKQSWRKGGATVLALAVLGLAVTCGVTSTRWVGTVFPGFLIMANNVVASVSLPHWPAALHSHVYQHEVVAVGGLPVTTSQDVYSIVRRAPLDSPVSYTLKKDGYTMEVAFPAQLFTHKDYALLFLVYLLNGLIIALIGIGVWFLKPSAPAARALLSVGLAGGVFALTAADLYGPHWFFRLHILGEAFLPAGLLHLALVFPADRLRQRRFLLLSVPYLIAGGLSVAYQFSLYQPAPYSFIHNLCMTYAGIAGLLFVSRVVWEYWLTDSELTRRRIWIVLLGILGGYAFPAVLMFSSGVLGGKWAVNYAGFTGLLFPLSVGYAVVKRDLFEIDTVLKRGLYYLTLTTVLTCLYVALVAVLNLLLRSSELVHSPLFALGFALAVTFLFQPVKDHLQRGIDRVFFRLRYDPQQVLKTTSAALAATLHLEEIVRVLRQIVTETLNVRQDALFLLTHDESRYVRIYPTAEETYCFPPHHPLLRELKVKKTILSRYDFADHMIPLAGEKSQCGGLERGEVQLVVPLFFKDTLIGFLTLGHKESGTFFSAEDINFLLTLANQGAVAIVNALSYQKIENLNASLEQKVRARTDELAVTNTKLQTSFVQLEGAYRDLQSSQEHLVRTEKMAALGRLTAGIAHEINTPLGASLNSLELLQELACEYRSSIGDASVSEHDHREIVAEMEDMIGSTQQWLKKAAAHIRSLKLHTRDLQSNEGCLFPVLPVIEDARLLLSHRLRLSQYTVTVACSVQDPMLHGDPGKLGQVLTNLLSNAMDAYKDASKKAGDILVSVNEADGELSIRVRDQGCGIPPENREKIFDELFSTKPFGEGTGLGLPIARNIMMSVFGGDIEVESTPGRGSVFILRFPQSPELRSSLTRESQARAQAAEEASP